MKGKTSRLETVRLILSNTEIQSQDDLLKELKRQGFELTQATLSRDLKLLKAAKVANRSGQYVYVLPNSPLYKRTTAGSVIHGNVLRSDFKSIDFSGNIAVIHTRPGYASGLSAEIDTFQLKESVGTLAGDDTILLIMAPGVTPEKLKDVLRSVIPEINTALEAEEEI